MQSYYPVFAVIGLVSLFVPWLAFFYYLVVTSQVGTDPRRGRRVLSTAVMVLAVCFLVVYGSIVFETLSTYDASFNLHQAGAYVQPGVA